MTPNVTDEGKIKEINDKLKINFNRYKKALLLLSADAPIEVLCLPKVIENILLRDGCVRIYDIFDRDLTKIKGFGDSRIANLTSRLDEFISMSF